MCILKEVVAKLKVKAEAPEDMLSCEIDFFGDRLPPDPTLEILQAAPKDKTLFMTIYLYHKPISSGTDRQISNCHSALLNYRSFSNNIATDDRHFSAFDQCACVWRKTDTA